MLGMGDDVVECRRKRDKYLSENFLGKSLGDLVDIGFNTSLCKTSLLSLGESLDVAIHGVLGREMMLADVIISSCSYCCC